MTTNFTDIGFNRPPHREWPSLRALVAAGLAGAVLYVVWQLVPYAAAMLLVLE